MAGVSHGLPWLSFCQFLETLCSAKRGDKQRLLRDFLASYRRNLATHKQRNPLAEDSILPVLRLLLPSLDKDRIYGIKEKRLADLYVKVLGISKTSPDAEVLTKWKTAGGGLGRDFGEVAYKVLKKRCCDSGGMSLAAIDEALGRLADHHANSSSDGVTSTLTQLVLKLSALEQKWLIRVLIKDLGMGMGAKSVLDAWHPDAQAFYDVNMSLFKVSTVLLDPSKRLHEASVSLFTPCRPMLAERMEMHKLDSLMQGDVHYKYFINKYC